MSFMSPPPPGFGKPVLPPDDTVRWVPSRKAAVLAAIRDGHVSLEEACKQRAVSKVGTPGLRVTRVQIYRPLFEQDEPNRKK
jgi:hypothetical protein